MLIDPTSKVRQIEELKVLVRQHQKSGRKVVFANGCFDLIHVGHIRYLESAKALGDILVLGVNGDASVRALKGKGRPIQSESDRAEILSSLECVDYVLMFEAVTADGILQELRPDIHAKGTDYTEETVPERATVLSYGGRVAIAGDSKAHSTRDIIDLILSKCSIPPDSDEIVDPT